MAAALSVGAVMFGTTGVALADTQTTTGTTPPVTTTTHPTTGHGAFAIPGLVKAVFKVFDAVRTQAPGLAAPVIAQGVTDGTITQAEADQLTALFGPHTTPAPATTTPATPSTRSGHFGQFGRPGTGTGTSTATGGPGHAGFAPLSAGQLTVMHKVITAIISGLPGIASPVLDQEVAAGDLSRSQADLILKVLTKLTSIGAGFGGFGGGAGHTTTPAPAPAANPLATLQARAVTDVKKAAKKKAKKKHVRHHRSAR